VRRSACTRKGDADKAASRVEQARLHVSGYLRRDRAVAKLQASNHGQLFDGGAVLHVLARVV
jgi:hypothetical protein